MPGMIEDAVRSVLLGQPGIGATSQPDSGSMHKIVVCQRGFVYAGDVEFSGDYIVIRDAVNVRKWGTARGLGELAAKGALPGTKADPCGVVRVHRLAVVSMLDCEARINATA